MYTKGKIVVNGKEVATPEQRLKYYQAQKKQLDVYWKKADAREQHGLSDQYKQVNKQIRRYKVELTVIKLREKQYKIRNASAYDKIDKQITKLRDSVGRPEMY